MADATGVQVKMRVVSKTGAQAGAGGERLVQVQLATLDPKDPPCNITVTVPAAQEANFPTWGVAAVTLPAFEVPATD